MNNNPAFATYVTLCGSRKEAARRMGVSLAMIDHILSGFRMLFGLGTVALYLLLTIVAAWRASSLDEIHP